MKFVSLFMLLVLVTLSVGKYVTDENAWPVGHKVRNGLKHVDVLYYPVW